MSTSNHDRVGAALSMLREGLAPFVERELQARYGKYWITQVTSGWTSDITWSGDESEPHLDVAALLRLMWDQWREVFSRTLGYAERSLVSELRDTRNNWAHQGRFSSDDAYRAIDSVSRLLTAISAPQAEPLEKMKMDLLRVRFDEQMRTEQRKNIGSGVLDEATGGLKAWREIVTPHPDVASGRYQQAEFAADLWQVHLGEGSDEYRNPVEFFRRTYLTESLKHLLVRGAQRLAGKGGDPVVQLQTNFGGGKTHAMLALYHLMSGTPSNDLLGVDDLLREAGVDELPVARRVVLVGNKISPGNPSTKPDGTVVRTLWGELAWQLGGREAFERVRADDENATSPGDALRELFNQYGPCLILIDEWVAYARQLHDQSVLPAGSFETQFSFAQALTESAKLAKQCLLVVSLPASDTGASPHARADDAEVGGQRGREALDRIRNVVGRLESSWRPASAEEGFEIVRRRLFEPLVTQEQFVGRDTVARAFFDLYRTQQQEFPPECHEGDYEKRLRAAYPIHPEVFDRLYNDWSTLAKFQRTRGVLRLMAAVIHSLWERGDRSPLIMPASIAIDDPRVQFELTRYLSDNWVPVIEKDVDGPNSLPLRLDGEIPNLGKFAACRRTARTIYLGSAPMDGAANRGIEDRRIRLGCVMPGETPAVFGDALRRLAASATYLYQDGARYWYSVQPTVTKLAEDRAEQLKRDPDAVARELEKRLRDDLRKKGDFSRVHPMPQSAQDVPDDLDARLVVLSVSHPYSKEGNSPAESAAKAILESRGNAPRLYRNTLVFLTVDKTRLQDLDEATRLYLAWESVLADKNKLDISPHQVSQAENQKKAADSAVTARIPEAYIWLLVPVQNDPHSQQGWQVLRLSGQEPLAERASRKLRNDELLVPAFAATRLRMELDRVPLWRGDHVEIKQLVEDFARYHYLPRLVRPEALVEAVRAGMPLVTWELDSFAYADSYDEEARRYRGLRVGQIAPISGYESGLLVRPSVAIAQLEAERSAAARAAAGATCGALPGSGPGQGSGSGSTKGGEPLPDDTAAPVVLKRFHGSVYLDPERVGRDASQVAEEVIAHLVGMVGARVKVVLDIEAEIPAGASDHVVRTVTENSRTLKFTSHGFERE